MFDFKNYGALAVEDQVQGNEFVPFVNPFSCWDGFDLIVPSHTDGVPQRQLAGRVHPGRHQIHVFERSITHLQKIIGMHVAVFAPING